MRKSGLVTAGPALDAAGLRAPRNVAVRPFAPHGELFPHAAAVVTHAGHGTVIRALAHGVPLVCIPMGRDQSGNALRVAARGAGRALSPGASVDALRRAIHEVVSAPRYRQPARLLAAAIQSDARSSGAVEELEGLALRGEAVAHSV